MSTMAERMAAAVERVTGVAVTPPEDWKIDTGDFLLTVERTPGSRRHTVKAARFIVGKAGRTMVAEAEDDWTCVGAMVGVMHRAERRANVLAAVSDHLTEDGWEIDPMIAGVGSGITARRAGIAVMVYSDGKVVSSDLTAAIYAEAVVKVVEEEMP